MTKMPLKSSAEIKKEKRQKEISMLRVLRQNSRTRIKKLASLLNIPEGSASYLFSKTGSRYIKKYSSLVDFEKAGYLVGVFFIVKPKQAKEQELSGFLSASNNINSLNRTSKEQFFVEAYFSSMAEFVDFRHSIEEMADNIVEHEIVEEIKREGFLG